MSEDQHSSKHIDSAITDEQLKTYMGGNISDAERHELELQMEGDPFTSDAAEGLLELNNKEVEAHITALQYHLRKQLNKRRKKKWLYFNQSTAVITFLIIMILAILAYYIIVKSGN
jgi:hypothetical protein